MNLDIIQSRMRKHHISFRHALEGLIVAFRTQPNFQVHLALSIFVLLLSIYFKVSNLDWLIIILTITLGLAIELLNTAIEFAVDLMTQEYKLYAKLAKDIAASAMFVYAVGSVLIAGVIFLPHILSLWPSF
jgi:diacylglycerol kinase